MGGDARSGAMASSGTDKMLRKLAGSVESGSYYEAQEMCKSVAARLTASRKYDDALTLLQESARTQLQHNQVSNGVELALQLVDVLTKSGRPVSDASLARIESVTESFFQVADREAGGSTILESSPTSAGCQKFLRAAIKWSNVQGDSAGAPKLHLLLANFLWKAHGSKELFLVCKHLITAGDTERLTQVLHQAAREGNPSEVDLFVVRGVLLCLCHRRTVEARQLYDAFVSSSANSDTAVKPSPLTNFANFFLTAIEKRSAGLADILTDCYERSLERDSMLFEYVQEAKRLFFPRNNPAGGGMANILGSLLRASGDD